MKAVLGSRRGHYFERLGILLIVVALTMGTTGCIVDDGHPTEIRNWKDLNAIRDNLVGSYVLMNDLDDTTDWYDEFVGKTVDSKGWQPIGTEGNAFKGTFDGNGHNISDLFIDRPDEDEVGLFGRVQEGAIKNVGLVSVNVTGKKSVGALVGYNWRGTLDSDTRPPSSKTYSNGSVTGEEDVGGLVGNNYDGIVNQCESSADIFHVSSAPDEKRWRAGGLVGLNSGTVLNCNYNGAVNGDRQVGGLVGLNEYIPITSLRGRVEGCSGAYCVHGNSEVGGHAGRNQGIVRCCPAFNGPVDSLPTGCCLVALNEGATGNALSSDTALPGSYVGASCGVNEYLVEDCSAEATVKGYLYVGGLVGWNKDGGNVSRCFSSGEVHGNDYVGGLVAKNDGNVSNSFWDTETSGQATSDGGTGKTTAEMKDISTYIQAEWDICAVALGELNTACAWNIVNGVTFPFLSGGGEEVPEIPDQPTTLVIGTARDTDESLAIFEQTAAGPVMREFVEQVNAVGGVHLSAYDTASVDCYVPLEIDMREINVATWDIGTITAEICADIADGDVHFLWGGPGTDSIFTQAPIANGAKTVLLTFEGGATSIVNDPTKLAQWPYVFITLSYSDWYQLPVLAQMLEAELGRTPKAYVVHIWSEHGEEYLATAEANFEVVGDVEVPFDPAELDADEVVLSAIAALGDPADPNYDIFCCFAYPDQVMPITALAQVLGFNPPAMVFGPGANFGFYAYSFGDPPGPAMVEGIMSFTVAAYAAKPEITAVYDAIAERMDDDAGDPNSGIPGGPPGILSLDYWGIPPYWAACEMWLEAVESVGYVDQELLRDALAAFEDDPADTILGDCWFRMYGAPGEGGGNLDYLCHIGEIAQWQSGEFETVGYEGITADLPNYVVTGDLMFPMTDLWNWLQD